MRPALCHPRSARPAFTLVEVLVAAALCVLVMYVMATAFQAATGTLSQLRTVVNLAEQLGSFQTVVRRDLQAQHLADSDANNNAPKLVSAVSDPTVYSGAGWTSPQQGFFRVVQGTIGTDEGGDTETPPIHSFSATDQYLHFTSKLIGVTQQNVYAGRAPRLSMGASPPGPNFTADNQSMGNAASVGFLDPNTPLYGGEWAEILLYMRPSPVQPAAPPGVTLPTLYTLYRRQAVMARDDFAASTSLGTLVDPSTISGSGVTPSDYQMFDSTTAVAKWPELSVRLEPNTQGLNTPQTQPMNPNATWTMNSPTTVTNTANRINFGKDPTAPHLPTEPNPTIAYTGLPPLATPTPVPNMEGGNDTGNDVLLQNVVSLQVQVLRDKSSSDPASFNPNLFGDLPQPSSGTLRSWDTTNANNGTTQVRLRAVRLTVRVYDPKNNVTRQMTLVQPL